MIRVMCVDDDVDLLDGLVAILKREGLDVSSSTDPFCALEAMKRSAPDVLVTDGNMPRMHGTELVFWAREAHPNLPVLFLTGDPVEGMNVPRALVRLKGCSLDDLIEDIKMLANVGND